MKLLIVTAAVAALLMGCTAPTQVSTNPIARPPFPEHEYAALATTGTAIVTGQAFLKTLGGDVKTAAGEGVYLNPVTSYSTYAYTASDGDQRPMAPPDQRLLQYVKSVTADATGRFTFKNVPPGDYYVTTKVTWQAPTGYQGALSTQGGVLRKRVTAKNSESTEVILTR